MIYSLSLITLVSMSGAIEWRRGDPIIWTPITTPIIKAKVMIEANIRLGNPCSTLESISKDQITKSAITECTAIFNRLIIDEFDSLYEATRRISTSRSRPKRFVLEFASGWFLSNLLDTVIETAWPNKPNAEQTDSMVKRLNQLNEEYNLTSHMYSVLTTTTSDIDQRLTSLQGQFDNLYANYPRLSIAVSFIISRSNTA